MAGSVKGRIVRPHAEVAALRAKILHMLREGMDLKTICIELGVAINYGTAIVRAAGYSRVHITESEREMLVAHRRQQDAVSLVRRYA